MICFRHISELAAIRLEDEPLWDGQAKSSRYQNFGPSGCYVPDAIHGTETEGAYRGILGSLFNAYQLLHDPLKAFLSSRTPRPESMKPGDYDRTIAARTFDVTRYLLPLSVRTNMRGQGGQYPHAGEANHPTSLVAAFRAAPHRRRP